MKYFIVQLAVQNAIESGESCGSTYSLDNACQACGTNARLIGQLKTKGLGSKNKLNLLSTIDDDILISEDLHTMFYENGIDVSTFRKVLNWKNDEIPFYHINECNRLPKSVKIMGVEIEGQCTNCCQNGYFNDVKYSGPIFTYNKEVFSQKKDFYFTWETIGYSNKVATGKYVVRYARPFMVISQRVKELIETIKKPKKIFTEIMIQQ